MGTSLVKADLPNRGLMLHANQVLCVRRQRRMIGRPSLVYFILITYRSKSGITNQIFTTVYRVDRPSTASLFLVKAPLWLRGVSMVLCLLKQESA